MTLLESFRGRPRAFPAGNFQQEYLKYTSNSKFRGAYDKSPLAVEFKVGLEKKIIFWQYLFSYFRHAFLDLLLSNH